MEQTLRRLYKTGEPVSIGITLYPAAYAPRGELESGNWVFNPPGSVISQRDGQLLFETRVFSIEVRS